MSIINRLRSAIRPGTEEEEMYTYECTVCQTTFESTDTNPRALACTSCGAMDVTTVEGS